jgi:hypothetical protein
MKSIIKKILKEDFEWATEDIVPFLEIGEPLVKQTPKKVFRLYLSHGFGDDGGIITDNWVDYNIEGDNIDLLQRHIKILNYFSSDRKHNIVTLSQLWAKGETWVLSDTDNRNIVDEIGTYDKESGMWVKDGIECDIDVVNDFVYAWLREELFDYAILEYDHTQGDDLTPSGWHITYFDEFGVEHSVKVNL